MTAEQPPTEPPQQPPPPPAPVAEPALAKLTRGHSCLLCQQRKVRCDRQKPCANCIRAQVECRVVPPQPPRRRKKKPQERDLVNQLRKYEALLSQHGISFEPVARDLKPSSHADDVADLEQDLSGLKASPSSPLSLDQTHAKPDWYREYRPGPDDDSSDEDYRDPTIHHAYDAMFENTDGFPFVVGGSPAAVTKAHPSTIQIFQLWQIYISNVNPLLKITHTPTLQPLLISAGANPARIAKPLEALMFAIYFAAITSLTEEEVQSTFGEDKAILLGKYHNATQQALVNAGFMRSHELTVLQAFFLYLLCARQYVDPRSMHGLLGLAFRIATRLGLHRDGAQSNLSPFEAEQRRRLWWQIVVFDKRISELTGSAVTALSSCNGNTRMPLNINDADLNVHTNGQPGPSAGPTEMLFCLTRVEVTVASTPSNAQPAAPSPGGKPLHKPRLHYSPAPSSPDVVTYQVTQNLPGDLTSFCAYMENVYLKQCDPKIPLHYFTLLFTRQALCKMRVINFLRTTNTDNVDHSERDGPFMEAIQTIEYDNIIQSSDRLQGFRWYTYAHFPLPAYLCLVLELRQRTTGELCERAWAVMIENHERRGLLKRYNRNPLHIALGRYFVEAWDAREAAELQLGRSLPTPKIVTLLRNTVPRWQRPARPPVTNSGGAGAPGGQQQQLHHAPPPVQAMVPSAAPGNSAGIPAVGGVSRDPAGMYPGKPPMAQSTTSPSPPQMSGPSAGSGGLMMDDSMMYSDYDENSMGEMYGNSMGAPSPMHDVDVGHMDWNYLVQLTSFGGYNPSYYDQDPGPSRG